LDYESKIIKSENVGAIYRHINSRLVHKTGIAPLNGVNHQMVFDDLAKAELLNEYLVNFGTIYDANLPPVKHYPGRLDSVVFDREEIIRTVNKLKMNTAP
jgi:hypothetical protein